MKILLSLILSLIWVGVVGCSRSDGPAQIDTKTASRADEAPAMSDDVDVVIIVLHRDVPAGVKITAEWKAKDSAGDEHVIRLVNAKGGTDKAQYAGMDAPTGEKIKSVGKPKLKGDTDKVVTEFKYQKMGGRTAAVIIIKKKPAEGAIDRPQEVAGGSDGDCSAVFGFDGVELSTPATDCGDTDSCIGSSCED
jgi:hypothetical protein